jgi:hypothetical protein
MPQLSFRADDELAARVEALAVAMKKRLRGLEVSRSDLLKTLIKQALPTMELEFLNPEDQSMTLPENRLELITETIRALLKTAELEGFDIKIAGYRKK